MNNCPNCGSQLQPGMNNCPNCGTTLNNGAYQQGPMPNQNMGMSGGMPNNMGYQPAGCPPIENRNILVAFLLSLVTCGIYGLYWLICMTDESNSLSESNKTASGGMTILFIILTCGFYSFYWYYKMGKKMYEAGIRYGRPVNDNSVLYLILAIIGFGIVDYIMIQNDLNKFASQ